MLRECDQSRFRVRRVIRRGRGGRSFEEGSNDSREGREGRRTFRDDGEVDRRVSNSSSRTFLSGLRRGRGIDVDGVGTKRGALREEGSVVVGSDVGSSGNRRGGTVSRECCELERR